MTPKKTFTHFLKIQKTSELSNRESGLNINTNTGIIYDAFEESFYGVQGEETPFYGEQGEETPEKVIIAINKNATSSYPITQSYKKADHWVLYPKVYGYFDDGTGYFETDNSKIIPLKSKLVNNNETILDRIKNNVGKHNLDALSTYLNNPTATRNKLESIAAEIGAME